MACTTCLYTSDMTNNLDPDQTASYSPSDLDTGCLPSVAKRIKELNTITCLKYKPQNYFYFSPTNRAGTLENQSSLIKKKLVYPEQNYVGD